jgi:hypothetical protein
MDFSPPELLNVTLLLGESELKYTRGVPIGNVRVRAYMSEESSLNISSIVADFSELNARSEYSNMYKSINMERASAEPMRASCSNVSEKVYECTWNSIMLWLPTASTPVVRFYASDNLSNYMNASFTVPITFDNTQPVISAVRTGIADDRGRYWVGKGNNTIYVDIAETGSGFAGKHLRLDVGDFGSQPSYGGSRLILPTNCTEGWICTFGYVIVASQHKSGDVLDVFFSTDSYDDAGNTIIGPTNTGLYYDDEPPQIVSVQNSTICPTAPDSVDLVINVSERYSGGVHGELYATELSTNFFPQEFECKATEMPTIWTCEISIDNLVTYYVNGKINITLIDRAGNSNTTTVSQEVCEAAPGVPPNILRLSVDPETLRPSKGIDRKIGSQIPYPLFFNLNIFKSTGAVQDMKLDGCTISNGSIVEASVVTPWDFAMPLISTKAQLDASQTQASEEDQELLSSVPMTCQFSFIVRAGNKVYELPEVESVTFEVPLYNFPLGYIPGGVDSKIADLDKEIADLEDTIDGLSTTNSILGTICTLGEILGQAIVLMQALKALLYVIGLINSNGDSWYASTCNGIDKLSDFVIKWAFNPFLSSNKYKQLGWWLRLFCTWYTCELSESGNFIDSIAYLGNTRGNTYRYTYDGDETQSEPTVASEIALTGVSMFADYDYSVYKSIDTAWAFLCIPGILYNYRKDRQIKCIYRTCIRSRSSSGLSTEVCERMYEARECVYVESAALKGFTWSEFAMFLQGLETYAMNFGIQFLGYEGLKGLKCTWANEPSAATCAAGVADAATRAASDAGSAAGSAAAGPAGPVASLASGAVRGAADAALPPTHWCGRPNPECPNSADTEWKNPMNIACGMGLAGTMWLAVNDMIGMFDKFDWNKYDRELGEPDFCSGG